MSVARVQHIPSRPINEGRQMAAAAALLLLGMGLPSQVAAEETQQCDVARAAGLTLRPASAAGVELRPECKAVSIIRHAQGTHNAAEETTDLQPPDQVLLEKHSKRTYWDAPLTAEGKAQALALRGRLAAADARVEVVVSSTLTRALQTAIIAFGEGPDLPPLSLPLPYPAVVATDLCRERVADFTCDGRREISLLQRDFPGVNFSEVRHERDTMWAQKEVAEGELKCRERAVRFAEWLMDRPERHIAVVSHGHFLRHLANGLQPEQADSVRLKNAEMREMELCFASGRAVRQPYLATDLEYEGEEAARLAAESAALRVDEEARLELQALEEEAYQRHLMQFKLNKHAFVKMQESIEAMEQAQNEAHMTLVRQ